MSDTEKEIQAMVDRETQAWDDQDAETLVSLFHPDMVWPWPPDARAHDPVEWVFPYGRYDHGRWRAAWQTLFDTHTLVHNRRRTIKIVVSEQGDGAFAVVDIDTLWRDRQGQDAHWLGRAAKGYTRVGSEWKLIMHTGLLCYEDSQPIVELLSGRVSVRKYQDRDVPEHVLHEILEAGRLSPSGGNEQPWLFGVISDRRRIAQVAEIAYGQTWIAQAPVLIVLCTMGVGDERGGRDIQRQRFPGYAQAIGEMDQGVYWALNQEEHQTKIAGAHMALAALARGVGSCWVSRFEVKRLASFLNLPDGCLPSEILVCGYPDRQRKPTRKKELHEIVFYDVYQGDE